MQKAVILAAGKSTRTYPLTLTRPKALLKIGNRTILSVLLDGLNDIVKEVILVVGYKKEMIQKEFGNTYKNLTIRYVEQKEQKGTGHALLQAEKYVGNESFFVIGGDDYFDARDLQQLAKQSPALLCQEVEHPEQYGVVIADEKQQLVSIEEKPKKPKSKLVNTGCYILDQSIFPLLKKLKTTKREEYELTDAVQALARMKPVRIVKAVHWQPITYPWHLLDANKKLLHKIKFINLGVIEKGVTIHGPADIGKGTILKSGTYLEGPVVIGNHCTIGPNCYIRPETALGNHVKIGNAVEIKNSIIGDHTHVGHLSYIGDSVLGAYVNLGAGTIVANLRHDNGSIKSEIGKELVDSDRRKLGAILGDQVHTGIHTSIYPGRKLWPETITVPGEIVRKDKKG